MPDLKERYSCSGPEAIERICGPSCLMPRRGGDGRASFNLGSITSEFKIQGWLTSELVKLVELCTS